MRFTRFLPTFSLWTNCSQNATYSVLRTVCPNSSLAYTIVLVLMLKRPSHLTLFTAIALIVGSGLVGSSSALASYRGDLTIEINGLENQTGKVCLTVFNGSQGFPSDAQRAIKAECLEISELPFQITFDDLAYGSYAVAAYHDTNEDTQLNQGVLGIPTEGFAFSNDAPVRTGPASFQDAMFVLSQQNFNIQMQMRYWGDRS